MEIHGLSVDEGIHRAVIGQWDVGLCTCEGSVVNIGGGDEVENVKNEWLLGAIATPSYEGNGE